MQVNEFLMGEIEEEAEVADFWPHLRLRFLEAMFGNPSYTLWDWIGARTLRSEPKIGTISSFE